MSKYTQNIGYGLGIIVFLVIIGIILCLFGAPYYRCTAKDKVYSVKHVGYSAWNGDKYEITTEKGVVITKFEAYGVGEQVCTRESAEAFPWMRPKNEVHL